MNFFTLFSSLQPSQAPFSPVCSSPNLAIRPAQARDLVSLTELLLTSFHARTIPLCWIYPLLRLGVYEDLRSRLRTISSDYICLVAVDSRPPTNWDQAQETDEVVMGTVEVALRCAYPWQPREFQHLYVSSLAVDANCRRQGIAQRLLRACEQIAIDRTFQDLYLHVMENNDQARRLYFKAGYRLRKVEVDWTTVLLGRPRKLLLHKHLVLPSG